MIQYSTRAIIAGKHSKANIYKFHIYLNLYIQGQTSILPIVSQQKKCLFLISDLGFRKFCNTTNRELPEFWH